MENGGVLPGKYQNCGRLRKLASLLPITTVEVVEKNSTHAGNTSFYGE
jgi:hypothetical protein